MPRAFLKAKEFLEFLIDDERFQVRHVFDATSRGAQFQIFRGQRNVSWRLVPSAHRPDNRLGDYTPQAPGKMEGRPSAPAADPLAAKFMARSLALHLHAELRAVFMFLERADKLGIPTPINYEALHAHQALLDAAMDDSDCDWSIPFQNRRFLRRWRWRAPWRSDALAGLERIGVGGGILAVCDVSTALTGYVPGEQEVVGVFILDTEGLGQGEIL